MDETKKTLEALELLKKEKEITYSMLFPYVRVPQFSESIKQKILDIVRKNPPLSSKEEVENLFDTNKWENRNIYLNDVDYVFSNIDNKPFTYSYASDFWNEYLGVIRDAFNQVNSSFAFEDWCADAYTDCISDLMADFDNEWYQERITLDEWKAAFLEAVEK